LFKRRFSIQGKKMKNELPKWRELLWRRKLSDAEQVELRTQPEVSADLEMEIRLSETLARIPNASVPSNFTARVMQAVELEEAKKARLQSWNWRSLLPRVAFAMVAIGFAGLALHRYELDTRRAALAQGVALVAAAEPLPSVEALKNFDAIRRMSQPRADEELLALLQ
jgi:anti-sigma factor RsiW